jgi:hypothetical protein
MRQAGERPDIPCLLTRDQAPSSSAAPGGNTSFQPCSTETVERSSPSSRRATTRASLLSFGRFTRFSSYAHLSRIALCQRARSERKEHLHRAKTAQPLGRAAGFLDAAAAVRYAKSYSDLHAAVIRVYDEAGNVIEMHEHKGDFKEW